MEARSPATSRCCSTVVGRRASRLAGLVPASCRSWRASGSATCSIGAAPLSMWRLHERAVNATSEGGPGRHIESGQSDNHEARGKHSDLRRFSGMDGESLRRLNLI